MKVQPPQKASEKMYPSLAKVAAVAVMAGTIVSCQQVQQIGGAPPFSPPPVLIVKDKK